MVQKIQSSDGVKGERKAIEVETKDTSNLARPDLIGKTIVIARFVESYKMLSIMGLPTKIKLNWAEGMIGAIPVFDTMENALKYDNNPDIWEVRTAEAAPKRNDAKKVAEDIMDKKASELDKALGGDVTRKPQNRDERKSKAGKAGKTKSNKTFTENGARRRKV